MLHICLKAAWEALCSSHQKLQQELPPVRVGRWEEFVRQLIYEESRTLRGPRGTCLDQDMLKLLLLLSFMKTGSNHPPWLLCFAICPTSSGTTIMLGIIFLCQMFQTQIQKDRSLLGHWFGSCLMYFSCSN